MEKHQIQEKQEKILVLIQQFCTAHLDEEYYEISERLVKKMGRKRAVPFVSGQVEIWAAAVIHAIGSVNFLFDKASKPYTSIDEINDFFGTKKTTTGGKSKIIRDLFKMTYYDKEFSTKALQASSPFNNLMMFNGLIVRLPN
jgi:hypothetical protein